MAQSSHNSHTQIGGACTAAERDELDEHLFELPPEDALKTLMELEQTRIGSYEYTLAIGRLYNHLQYLHEHGFPPDPGNVFWAHVRREADELDLSNVQYVKKAMQHVKNKDSNDHYHCAQFEIQFLQKPALWWQKPYELTFALDDQIFDAPVPLTDLKRVLTDTAIAKLTDPEMIEDLSIDDLIFARREALKAFRYSGQVSFVNIQTYSDLGFEIGREGWIQRVDISLQRPRGYRQTKEADQIGPVKTGKRPAKKGWAIHKRTTRKPY